MSFQEELSKQQASLSRPIPGQSLTNDPENPAPYERPPEFVNPQLALETIWEKFISKDVYPQLMETIADGTPLMDLTQVILYHGLSEGKWNPDLMLLLIEPVTYMLMALAERQDIPMTIYSSEADDDVEEEAVLGTTLTEDKLKRFQQSKESGTVPEGILNAEMKQELAELPQLDSLLSRSEAPQQQTDSLMSKTAGA
jgi:hypothetical protein|tara:strand:+ start:2278 stop:2871 length:594 start_codon:yes stop_codon:yes gene_type:complete